MNLEDLLPDTGKLTAIHAAEVAIQKTELVSKILDLAFSDKHPISTRAANTIEIIDSKKPELIEPFYLKIIQGFPKFHTSGVKRCLLKIFTRHTDIQNEEMLCLLLNYCFERIASADEEVGVKAYSLLILYNISNREPDLKNELIFAIKDQLPKNSKAFSSLGKRILKKLYKETC